VKLIDFDASARFAANRIKVYGQMDAGSSEILGVDQVVCHREKDSVRDTMQEYAGCKFSSAYLPPEMFYVHGAPGEVSVSVKNCASKEIQSSEKTGNIHASDRPFDPVLADPSIDMWAFGAVLYLLCSGNIFSLRCPSVDSALGIFV
jgi:serine/threonine protein kinase